MQRVLSAYPNVIVIDNKHELNWPGFTVTKNVGQALGQKHSIVRLGGTATRPTNIMAELDELFKRVYQMGGWHIYIDEIYTIGRGNVSSFPQSYITLLTRGRSRHITVWTGTQRPRFLPLFAFTESTHFFILEVSSSDDRKHIAKMAGVDGLDTPVYNHDFLYYNRRTKALAKSRLSEDDLL